MATELSRDVLQRLARMGAARRLEELRQEEAAIRAAFPDLDTDRAPRGGRRGRASGRGAGAKAGTSVSATSTATENKAKRRYKMTAAQKRAVSERMKKYWAARRKAKG